MACHLENTTAEYDMITSVQAARISPRTGHIALRAEKFDFQLSYEHDEIK